ncbi:MAG: RluA family pseudouridine synthase [Firmicutes bacterium]|nr:RluA family pseudouridine synthase [Bacillota bacterium]
MNKQVIRAEARERVDKYISSVLDYSRAFTEQLLLDEKVMVNEIIVKKNHKLNIGDTISIDSFEPVEVDIKGSKIDLDIVYEDDDIIVINKQKGLVVHPAPGNYDNTLVNGLMYYNKNLSTINGEMRPGIVHRIDKDTSGVIVVAKNDKAHNALAKQFKDHSITRKYLALVVGNISEATGEINLPIGRDPKSRTKMAVVSSGKQAKTHYRVLENFDGYTLVECRLETGRTHQIRVHMRYIKHPLVGDPLYGSKSVRFPLDGQYLHAGVLGFIHPSTGEYIEFNSDLPAYFQETINELRG